jgi:hypothetical protein
MVIQLLSILSESDPIQNEQFFIELKRRILYECR